MGNKIIFKNTFQRKNEGSMLFIPFVFSLAARMANLSLREMVWDPSYYTYALEGAYKLFHYGAIINHFDDTLEAESCGCELEWQGEFENPVICRSMTSFSQSPEGFLKSGRIPIVLEVTKRLSLSLGKETAIIGVLNGPCSLMKSLEGEQGMDEKKERLPQIGSLLTRWVRNLCELKLDGVIIREDRLGKHFWEELRVHQDLYQSIYMTLFNIIRAFNSHPILILKDFNSERVRELYLVIKPSAIILLHHELDEKELFYLRELSDSLKISFGLPLPIGLGKQEDLWDRLSIIQSFVLKHGARGLFYTSEGEIPYSLSLELFHELMGRL